MWTRKNSLGIWEVSHKRGDLGSDLETHMTCLVSWPEPAASGMMRWELDTGGSLAIQWPASLRMLQNSKPVRKPCLKQNMDGIPRLSSALHVWWPMYRTVITL